MATRHRPHPEIDLRLIVITDAVLAAPRNLREVVAAALDAGAPAIQLRDKHATARDLFREAASLRELTRRHGALLFVDDRLDVALAAGADGVHLGPDDVPLERARAVAPRPFLIGFSTDDPRIARSAEAAGADYIGCGAVFGTSTKAVGEERIGTARLDEVARAVRIPVVGIGGIDATNIADVARTAAAGAAVVGAIMKAPDPRATTAQLLRLLEPR